MQCDTCNHKSRLQIDREIIQGKNLSKIAKEYNLSYNSVYNHSKEHISRQLAQSMAKKQLAEDLDILHEVESLIKRTKHILDTAEKAGKLDTALRAIGEARGSYQLLTQTAFQLHEIRIAELQIERERTGQTQLEADELFREDLQRLSDSEVILLELLSKRLCGEIDKPIMKEGRYLSANELLHLDDFTKEAREQLDWSSFKDDKPSKTPSDLSEEKDPTLNLTSHEKNDPQTDLPHSAEVEKDSQPMKRTKPAGGKKYRAQETPPDKKKVYPRSDDLTPLPLVGDLKRSKQSHKESVPFSVDKGLGIKNHEVRND